jgi:ribosomal protein L11 methyltransferase
MAWLQLRISTEYPEFADEVLQAQGASAVSFVDAEDDPVLEPAPGETPLWTNTVTLGLFTEQTDLTPVIAALREQLPDGGAADISSELIEDRDWVRVWLKDCPPLKFGERLWVCPHEKKVEEPGAVTLLLDPGLAFGTGTHPSTALCLEWLATHDVEGWNVLDYGCGSGILAIAALKLGAASAVGYDIDVQAIQASRDNAQANGVLAQLTTVPPEESITPFPADLVLANILAKPLISLAPLLASSVRQGGWIVLAGLLDRQAEEVRSAYDPWFDFEPDVSREGWTRLAGRCRMPAMIAARRISPQLMTAGQPRREHFPVLASGGVKTVINLAMPSSPNYLVDEAELVHANGMEYHALPIEWTRPTAADFAAFCSIMSGLGDRKCLVHCALNMRVSAFVFLWRVLRCNEDVEASARDLYAIWQPDENWTRFISEQLQAAGLVFPRPSASPE